MKNKKKWFVVLIVAINLVFILRISAIDNWTDNFESYNLGDLTGQDNWTGNGLVHIQTDFPYTGTKSASFLSGGGVIKHWTGATSGIFSFYVMSTAISEVGDEGDISLMSDYGQNFRMSTRLIYNATTDSDWFQRYNTASSAWETIKSDLSWSWHPIQIEWKEQLESGFIRSYFRVSIDNDPWSSWLLYIGNPSTSQPIDGFYPSVGFTGEGIFIIDDINSYLGVENPSTTINITSPVSGSTASSSFSLALDYNKQNEIWDKIMIIFESWNASSVCPVYGTQTWQTEYNNDWFYYQSFPFYTSTLTASSGSKTMAISNLNVYNYNCVRCYFISESLATSSEEKCTNYILNVAGWQPISQPLPFTKWTTYYSQHTDSKFATSTAIFNTIAEVFDNLFAKVSTYLMDFKTIFNNSKAASTGAQFGEKIPQARGYLKPITDFLSNSPMSELFSFVILFLIIGVIYRITKTILFLIRG